MANIELIKALRERSGAGIMDCKNALAACNDDLDRATDWLREKGIAKAAKKANRIAAEGLAGVYVCEKCGNASIVEINCETDFVAKADPFKELVGECGRLVLSNDCKTIEDAIALTEKLFAEATIKMGEKLSFRRFDLIKKQDPSNGIGTYIHMGGTHGVVVLLEKDDPELAKSIAMHIAANNPKYITESDVPQSFIESETRVQYEAAKNDPKLQGKPEQALAKIIEGKVHKQYAEVTLVDQEYLMDGSMTVGQALEQAHNKVLNFIHYTVGEGIEKRVDDFVSEVMKQANV